MKTMTLLLQLQKEHGDRKKENKRKRTKWRERPNRLRSCSMQTAVLFFPNDEALTSFSLALKGLVVHESAIFLGH